MTKRIMNIAMFKYRVLKHKIFVSMCVSLYCIKIYDEFVRKNKMRMEYDEPTSALLKDKDKKSVKLLGLASAYEKKH